MTDVLYVMAADAEYGPHLRARCTPLITGVGPVEAAVAVSAELARRAEQGRLPDVVVSLGSAGSATLPQGGVFQVSSVSYRDMDASPLGFARGITPFLDLPAVLELPIGIPGVASASLSTGAAVVSGAMYDHIDADLVDMETYAVVRACQRSGVDVVGLRGVSDGSTDLVRLADWTEYLDVVDERLAEAVDAFTQAWASNTLERPGPA